MILYVILQYESPDRWVTLTDDGEPLKEITIEELILLPFGEQPLLKNLGGVRPVYRGEITHNLAKMAKAAGLYQPIWRPERTNITKGEQLIQPLSIGLAKLKDDPDKYKALNPKDGYSNYDDLEKFTEEYLEMCKANPLASVSVSH